MRLETGVGVPEFELTDIEGEPAGSATFVGKKLWLILGRFAACPFCSLRLEDVAARYAMVEKVGVEVLVIFPSSEKRVKQYVRKYSPPFRVAADPDQVVFQKFGSETSWAGDLRTAINLPKMMKAFARAKMNPLGVDDAPHRMPSEYLIDPDGEVAHVHYGQELDDGFPIREVMSWAEG